MAKRFTDTDKWKKPFIRSLPAPYKLLWFYILDDCNHAGIWEVDIEVASIRIGEEIQAEKALHIFGDRVQKISASKWFLPDFISFQYGELNEKNRVHFSIIQILNKYKIKGLTSPLQGAKDKEQDKDKDMDKDIVLSGKRFLDTEIGELPPVKIGAAKELLSITKNFEATDQDIITLWEAFKVQNLNGEKYYKSESEVQSHFINWLQTKKINGNKAINRSVKTAGAYDLLERIRKGASARGHEGT